MAVNSTHGKTGTQTLSGLPRSVKTGRLLNPSGGGDKLYYTYFEENSSTDIENQGPRFIPGEHAYKTNLNHTSGAIGSVGKMQSYCYTRVGVDGKIYTYNRHGGWSAVGDDGNNPAQVYRQGLDDVSNTAGPDLLGLTGGSIGPDGSTRGGSDENELRELEDALAAENNQRQGLMGRVKALQDSLHNPGGGDRRLMTAGGQWGGSRAIGGRVAQCSPFFQDERKYSTGDSDYARHSMRLKKLMSQPPERERNRGVALRRPCTHHCRHVGCGCSQNGSRSVVNQQQDVNVTTQGGSNGMYYTNRELFPGKKLYITKHTVLEDDPDDLPPIAHTRSIQHIPTPPGDLGPEYYTTTNTTTNYTTMPGSYVDEAANKKKSKTFKARSYEEFLAMQGPPPPIPVHKTFRFKCGGRQQSCAPPVNKGAAFAGGPGGSLASNNYTRIGQDGQSYTYTRSQGWIGGDGEGGAGSSPGAGGGNTYTDEGYGGHTFQNKLISKVVRPH